MQRTQSCVFGFVENRQNFHDEAGYVRCATCVITRGVSSIRVLFRALGGASIKTWILKGTPLFFFLRQECQRARKRRGKKRREGYEEHDGDID